jgi:hypothetical protein
MAHETRFWRGTQIARLPALRMNSTISMIRGCSANCSATSASRSANAPYRAQVVDLLARHASPFHADDVEAIQMGPIAQHHAIGDDVVLDPGEAADHGLLADADELVHGAQAAEIGVVLDFHVAAERGVVRHDHAVADQAIVGHVDRRHEQAAVADPRDPAAAGGPRVHGDVLADLIVGPDHQLRVLAAVLEVLRPVPQAHEREDPAAVADPGTARDHHVRLQPDAGPEQDLRPDHAVGADHDVAGQLRPGIHDSGRMNVRHAPQRSMILALITASAARRSSTVAAPVNFHTPSFCCCLSTLMRNWSPGTTGRRKRA